MAATTIARALISDTDANFRLWGKAISDQFLAGGWIQTSDTGQINWTTVTAPAAINTYQGYEIWRSNDAGGTIVDYYVKIQYGSNAAAANQPRISIQVGWGSNGSGTLTGITSTTITPQINTTASATTYNCNLAAGNNWIVVTMGTNTNQVFWFSIERTRDGNGDEQNEILIIGTDVTQYWRTQVIDTTFMYPQETNTTLNAYPTSSNAIQNGRVGVGLTMGNRGGLTNPSVNIMGVYTGQLGAGGGTVSAIAYGSTHTWMINSIVTGGLYWSNFNTYNLLTRYE